MSSEIPPGVRAAFGLREGSVASVSGGWINRTFVAEREDGTRLIVQRLHPIFRGEVNLDIDAITQHLEGVGLRTPRLVRARDGRAFVEDDGVWRSLSFVEGRTLAALDAPHARAAGALVGRFHRALEGFAHAFAFSRPGAHDTPAHLAKLARLRTESSQPAQGPSPPSPTLIDALAAEILERGAALPDLSRLPLRIIHGDLKATNILFAPEGAEAIALVDLDTLAYGTVAVELGDALRSWCNPTDESDPAARFDAARFASAVEGYGATVGELLTADEVEAIVPGVETIALELASRFAADVYEDRYFGWDATRFASRVEHNLARARGQLSLARSIAAQREVLLGCVRRVFAP
jgi:Ser/Thr protein kinase RdoA (MazF antagonist)